MHVQAVGFANGPLSGRRATIATDDRDTLVSQGNQVTHGGVHTMARSIRIQFRRRRHQRWLKREALVLAQEAAAFDCPEMRREARSLLSLVSMDTPVVGMA
jgi:hypothetical protein